VINCQRSDIEADPHIESNCGVLGNRKSPKGLEFRNTLPANNPEFRVDADPASSS